MVNPGVWASSGSDLLLGGLNGLAIAAADALDKLAEAIGVVEPVLPEELSDLSSHQL